MPLPTSPFQFTQVKYDVRAAPNYHIEFDKHYYSVPHEIARECVDVYQINNILKIYHDGNHVCCHKKEPPNYRYTTKDEHMPSNHKFVKGWVSPLVHCPGPQNRRCYSRAGKLWLCRTGNIRNRGSGLQWGY
ncbi:MAG TPA: hypothetical protein ENH01_01290 [Nitrospirae bacterium]|nr:hypothetical protein [Nitrospirota bacterium]